jgi:hypothetical protein
LREVLATQHWPEGTGRLPFWGVRGRTAAAEERATRGRRMVGRVNFMFVVVGWLSWFVCWGGDGVLEL